MWNKYKIYNEKMERSSLESLGVNGRIILHQIFRTVSGSF
jgi:hypothetical protein